MTPFQKIIKYGAIAFSIYLCFMIISMIVFAITTIFGITVGIEMFGNNNNTAMVTKWEEEYSNITKIDIDLSVCKLKIKKGNTLKVEASEVSEQFKCKVDGTELKIEDKHWNRNFFNQVDETKAEITIYMPEDTKFKEVKIETGINETNIEYLKADKINLEMGVGKYQIDYLSAKNAKIKAGAGEANINNSNIEELKLDGGIGKLVFTGKITNKAEVSCGVGRMELNLIGLPTDYQVKASTGLGNFEVDGKKMKDKQTIGNGDTKIEIDAGVGETVVNFQESKN